MRIRVLDLDLYHIYFEWMKYRSYTKSRSKVIQSTDPYVHDILFVSKLSAVEWGYSKFVEIPISYR